MMTQLILRRIAWMLIMTVGISVVSFFIIQLPPGDFLDAHIAHLQNQGDSVSLEVIENLRRQYGLDKPLHIQYFKMVKGMLHGDFGWSFSYERPATELIGERLLLTIILTLTSMLFTYMLAIPIGIYSAVNQYSISDYTFTFFGFIGLAVPNFLLALVLMYFAYSVFGLSIGGLFSPEYIVAPWSLARVWDLCKHLWIPAIVLGVAGTAGIIRVIRANLLDELQKPYVVTARAKGLREWKLILKYPVRITMNPVLSTIGYILPVLVSGSVIVSVVLSLPTVGPLLLRALVSQDMYLAGTIVLLLGVLTIIGTLISDILLIISDPRIRTGGSES